MSELSKFSSEDLLKELQNRKHIKPTPLVNPDFSKLKVICQRQLDELETGDDDGETEHYVYEEAMEAVFGENIWDYINEKI